MGYGFSLALGLHQIQTDRQLGGREGYLSFIHCPSHYFFSGHICYHHLGAGLILAGYGNIKGIIGRVGVYIHLVCRIATCWIHLADFTVRSVSFLIGLFDAVKSPAGRCFFVHHAVSACGVAIAGRSYGPYAAKLACLGGPFHHKTIGAHFTGGRPVDAVVVVFLHAGEALPVLAKRAKPNNRFNNRFPCLLNMLNRAKNKNNKPPPEIKK